MERKLQGRVRYDEKNDSFVYEIRSYYVDDDGFETDDEPSDWGVSRIAQCVRREGAEEWEGTDFIHYDFMKTIVADAFNWDVELILAGAPQAV